MKYFGKLGNLKALVVDDNSINRKVLTKFLSKWNLVYSEADDGSTAIELLQNESFDIIFMDIHMPKMDGFTTSKQIRNMGIGSPIIAISADINVLVKSTIQDSGMNDYIGKPFDPTILLDKIGKLVKSTPVHTN